MARLPKPVLVHEMNGNPSRKHLPKVHLEGMELPVGSPPRGLSAQEKAAWRAVCKEMPWLNGTHRLSIEIAVKEVARFRRLDAFFSKRRAQMRQEGKPESYAELNDEGTRVHPLVASHRDARGSVRAFLHDLGGTPSAQARLLGYINEQMGRLQSASHKGREKILT